MSEGRALWSGAEAELGASKLAEISRAIVALYKEQFGRGPTRVRSDFAGPDTLICTLKDTFTPSEHRLAQMGEHQRLRDGRLYLQHATEERLCAAVEQILDRRVRAFISGIDTHRDVSAEIFYLEAG